jgi:hypothetical protein
VGGKGKANKSSRYRKEKPKASLSICQTTFDMIQSIARCFIKEKEGDRSLFEGEEDRKLSSL